MNSFGIVWGGQKGITERILNGYDDELLTAVKAHLNLSDQDYQGLITRLSQVGLGIKIPYQFLPLQDCVDLAIFLIRATVSLQSWQTEVRGVGGAIDVATITRQKGFEYIQQKEIAGEARAR